MTRTLTTVTTLACDTEAEAKQEVERARDEDDGELIKHSIELKLKKAKGSVIGEAYVVTLKKQYDVLWHVEDAEENG